MKKNGFTLTELLSTIVIVAILIGISIPVYFSITKNAKENEYNSKKSYFESLAKRYAEENNVGSTMKISVSRLVAEGYTTAEKYVMEVDTEIPFISNPRDDEDNLACHVIDLNIDNYDYSAYMEDLSDCSFVVEETLDAKVGLSAYEIQNNVVGDKIAISSGVLSWTNKDVLVVVNPDYEDDEIKQIVLSTAGTTKEVDKTKMLTNISKNMTINPDNYTNLMLVSATAILRQEVTAIVELESTIKNAKVEVRIDKEAPVIDSQSFTGWTSTAKGATIYLSDGNGSGALGIYASKTNNRNSTNRLVKVSDEGTVYLKEVNEEKIDNNRYYLWAIDNAGNESKISTPIDVLNVDDEPPTATKVSVSSQITEYNSINVNVRIEGYDGNGSGVFQACVVNTNDVSKCDWKAYGATIPYTIPNLAEGTGKTIQLYGFVRDAVGNISQTGKPSDQYKLYKSCDATRTVDGDKCPPAERGGKCGKGTRNLVGYDKYIAGTRCTNADRSSGGSVCDSNIKCCVSPTVTNHAETATTANSTKSRISFSNSTATLVSSYGASYTATTWYSATKNVDQKSVGTHTKKENATKMTATFKNPRDCYDEPDQYRKGRICTYDCVGNGCDEKTAKNVISWWDGENWAGCGNTCSSSWYKCSKGTLDGTKCKVQVPDSCPDGYTYNSSNKKCEYTYYTCNSGYTLSGTTCYYYTYTCPNGGSLNGTSCNTYSYSCPSPKVLSANVSTCLSQTCTSGNLVALSCSNSQMSYACSDAGNGVSKYPSYVTDIRYNTSSYKCLEISPNNYEYRQIQESVNSTQNNINKIADRMNEILRRSSEYETYYDSPDRNTRRKINIFTESESKAVYASDGRYVGTVNSVINRLRDSLRQYDRSEYNEYNSQLTTYKRELKEAQSQLNGFKNRYEGSYRGVLDGREVIATEPCASGGIYHSSGRCVNTSCTATCQTKTCTEGRSLTADQSQCCY